MKNLMKLALAGALAFAIATPALSAGLLTNGLPPAGGSQYPTTLPLTGAETLPADTNLPSGLNPASESISAAQFLGFALGQSGSGGWRNALVGGDFGTNLYQRGTTGASTTTALLYGPDRWWGLSGTGTAFTQSKQTGASDVTTGFAASNRVQRTASQTGILPICVGQVLTSANSAKLQGKVVEFSAHMLAGADFSPSPDNVTMTVAYGTGADESAANFSTGAWTGYTAAAAQLTTISTTWTRYSAVASIPVTATQVGVKICYTPVGTAGTNDWFEFTGAQLDTNAAAQAYNGLTASLGVIASFERRPANIEALMQYSYFYRLAEPASTAAIPGSCQAVGASTNICNVFLPVPQRATTPVITITTAGTFKVNIAGTPTTIATPTASVCSSSACAVTAANTNTAGQAELLTGGGGTGAWDISSEL